MSQPQRVAVVGHVEHVALSRIERLPSPGEIVHLDEPTLFPGGGGGVAFLQLAHSDAEVHFFTALGTGAAAELCRRELAARGHLHASTRAEPHTTSVVLVTPDAERTIVVVGAPLQPAATDPLPWELLSRCDAVYFTGRDPLTLQHARRARCLVVTSRRQAVLEASAVEADVVVGSAKDPLETTTRTRFSRPPAALVLTEGARGGTLEQASGVQRFEAPRNVAVTGGAYGAGDTFAAALTWYAAAGLPLPDACARAGRHGAAVLAGLNPARHQLKLPSP